MAKLSLRVNGRARAVDVDPDTPLLYVLRNDLGLHAAKYGCGLGQCGACAVLVDGRKTLSCVTPVKAVASARITTLEGLGTPARPGPVQAAFVEEQAAQCGYCTNGMVVAAHALLQRVPRPTEAEVREALAGHLCRCGSHVRVLRAVLRAANTRPARRRA